MMPPRPGALSPSPLLRRGLLPLLLLLLLSLVLQETNADTSVNNFYFSAGSKSGIVSDYAAFHESSSVNIYANITGLPTGGSVSGYVTSPSGSIGPTALPSPYLFPSSVGLISDTYTYQATVYDAGNNVVAVGQVLLQIVDNTDFLNYGGDLCPLLTCENGGTCASSQSVFSCQCGSSGYQGTMCQDPICDPKCFNCTLPGNDTCLTCTEGNAFYESSCYSECPMHTFEDGNVCIDCDSSCLACDFIGSYSCTSCNTTSSLPHLLGTTCLSACPATGYYPDSASVCQTCDSTCYQCDGPYPTNCTACNATTGFPYSNGPTCVQSCPNPGYFLDLPTSACLPCDVTCITCNGTTYNDCLACADPWPYLFGTTCQASCPTQGYFADSTSMACVACDQSCLTCNVSSSYCTSCDSSVGLHLEAATGQCISDCGPATYVDTANTCQSCMTNCTACSSATTCTTCDAGFYGPSCLPCQCGPQGSCDIGTGVCTCSTGWTQSNSTDLQSACDVCSTDYYGSNCTKCPSCGASGSCADSLTGSGACLCLIGWARLVPTDPQSPCTTCDTFYYGSTCEACPYCANGECDAGLFGSGECTCSDGWTNHNDTDLFSPCDTCSANHFGVNCTTCPSCGSHGSCDQGLSGSGDCVCALGWDYDNILDTSSPCDTCALSYYGSDCLKCDCGQGTCDQGINGTGKCTCNYGWEQSSIGSPCDECSPGFFGSSCIACSGACSTGNSRCDDGKNGTGACLCNHGFDHSSPSDPACDVCLSGRYGPDCLLCTCGVGGICDEGINGTGACTCAMGWAQSNPISPNSPCDICRVEHYGSDCLECPMSCDQGICDQGINGTGNCLCSEGFANTNATDLMSPCSDCAEGHYGLFCEQCTCGSGTCDQTLYGNGNCTCNPGWRQSNPSNDTSPCDVCDSGFYGDNCAPCLCGSEGICDDGYTGTGMCACLFGFAQSTPDVPSSACDACAPGYYGAQCTECYTGNGTCADGINGTGINTCFDGWALQNSSDPYSPCDICSWGYYGPLCTQCECGLGACYDGLAGNGTCWCDVGWMQSNDTLPSNPCDTCQPSFWGAACSNCTCGNGICADGINGTGYCTCDHGYAQLDPSDKSSPCSVCRPHFYGSSCTACDCQMGTCDDGFNNNGSCVCDFGWAQQTPAIATSACDICAPSFYGSNCTQCACGLGGVCDDGVTGTGECTCDLAWEKIDLADPFSPCDLCAPGYYGQSCQQCTCGQGSCNDTILGDGSCTCSSGWQQTNTTSASSPCDTCQSGFWGANCTACTCDNGVCDDGSFGSGLCSCLDGWAQQPDSAAQSPCNTCAPNFYNSTCTRCPNCGTGGTCDAGLLQTGACNCSIGWTKSDPSDPQNPCDICLPGYFGAGCTKCNCSHGTCDDLFTGTGHCTCALGWANMIAGDLSTPCNECANGYYGANCTACTCNNAVCADGISNTGTCTCDAGWAKVNATALLAPCTLCSAGYYGPDCTRCNCSHGTCDDLLGGSGNCTCANGWMQSTPLIPQAPCNVCSPGFYGANCTQCTCGQGTCADGSSGSGACTCNSGWHRATGSVPQSPCDICAFDYYGPTCQPCTCLHGTCDWGLNATGNCNCSVGWRQDDPTASPSLPCDECLPNFYGPECLPCDCGVDGRCNDSINGTGVCKCAVGWAESNSSNPLSVCDICAPGYFGPQCIPCMCGPNGVCEDGITGSGVCSCNYGWVQGRPQKPQSACDTCDVDFFGPQCTPCGCGSNGRCTSGIFGSGDCICDVGWVQSYSQYPQSECDVCDTNYWGSECTACLCGPNGQCDQSYYGTGACTCNQGWILANETDPLSSCSLCDEGYYGKSCDICPDCVFGTCLDGYTGSGACACVTGYAGPLCDECAPGYGGANCSACPACENAVCSQGLTGSGLCDCDTGFLGPDGATNVSVPVCSLCSAGRYGPMCLPCTCGSHGTCMEGINNNGSCICSTGWAHNVTDLPTDPCDVCASGFSGSDCHVTVPCTPANCYPNSYCDDRVGECICTGNYTGSTCTSCLPGFTRPDLGCPADIQCPLNCSYHGTCDLYLGTCSCNPGWLNTTCNIPDPCFPDPCSNDATCIRAVNYVTGSTSFTCACVGAWTGATCAIAIVTPVVDSVVPSISPLQGTNVTVTGSNFQSGMTISLSYAGSVFFSRQLSDGDFTPNTPGSKKRDTTYTSFTIVFPIFHTSNVYVTMTLTNPSTGVTSLGSFYYTDNCPYEGEWGVGLSCQPCPSNAICPGGDRIYPYPGSWSPDNTTAPLVCPSPSSRCPGGSADVCAEGYTGTVCGDCADNYYSVGGQCLSCGGNALSNSIGYLLMDILFLVVLIISVITFRQSSIKKIVIAVATLQVLRTTLEQLEARLPPSMITIVTIIAYGSGNVSSMSQAACLLGSPFFIQFYGQLAQVVFGVVIVTVLLPLKWVWTHIVWPELLNWSRRHLFVYEEDVTDQMEMSNISGKFSSSSSLTALNDKGRKKSIAGDDKGRRKSSAAESDLATMSHSPRSPRGSKPGAVSFLKPRAVQESEVDLVNMTKNQIRYRRAILIDDLPEDHAAFKFVHKGDIVTLYGISKDSTEVKQLNATNIANKVNCTLPITHLELVSEKQGANTTLEYFDVDATNKDADEDYELAGLSIWQAMSIYTRQRLIRTILVVLLFEYTNTANVVFQAFICQDAFGETVLVAQPTQQCFTGGHISAFVISIFVLIGYLMALPIAFMYLLYRNRDILQTDWRVAMDYGYLYQAFRPSTYYAGVVWLAVLFLQGLAYSLTGVGPGATVVACITYGLFGIFLLVGRPFKLLIINLIGGIVMLFAVIVRIFIQANVDSSVFLDTALTFIIFSFILGTFVIGYPTALTIIQTLKERAEARRNRPKQPKFKFKFQWNHADLLEGTTVPLQAQLFNVDDRDDSVMGNFDQQKIWVQTFDNPMFRNSSSDGDPNSPKDSLAYDASGPSGNAGSSSYYHAGDGEDDDGEEDADDDDDDDDDDYQGNEYNGGSFSSPYRRSQDQNNYEMHTMHPLHMRPVGDEHIIKDLGKTVKSPRASTDAKTDVIMLM